MIVKFSQFDCGEKPTLVLKNLDGTAIQTLGYAFEIEADFLYNEVSTLTFKIPAIVDNNFVPGYNETVGMRIVDLVDFGQFILIDPEEEFDGSKRIKTCKAYSLEYEFMKKTIYLEAGTYNFYSGLDTSDPNTLVGRIRECLPEWGFDIDESLIGKYRTFDDVNKNVYDFIKSDVQKKYGCIFNFDTYDRIVRVIDVESFVPTKQVYLSSDNLINTVKTNEDSENIITCLDVNGAEGVTIRSVNPTGTNKIYNLDYFMTEKNFTPEFIEKWRKWETDCESKQSLYYDITMSYNMKLLAILTKEAEIADLEAELTAKENVQAVTIQGIAQNLKDDNDLDAINEEISSIKTQILELKNEVAEMKSSATDIHSEREEINKTLAFENYFSEDEMIVLRRYFIDDILQDSSFVAETASTYIEEDYTLIIADSSVTVSGAKEINEATDSLENKVVSFVGGTLNLESLSAKMIRGTLYFESNNEVVFSGYAENGTIGETSFVNGSITISGNFSSLNTGDTSLSFNISEGNLYFTEKCSEYKQHQIEWELYEYGNQVLFDKASPTYNFKVECSNFLKLEDYILFRNQLTLGQKIYLHLDDKVLEPYVVSVHMNFDDPTDFSIEFSDVYTSFDQSFHLAKLLDESVSTGKTLSYKSGMYSSFVNSGASTAVKDFMDSALDISKNAVLSSKNQAISFDDTGIRIRKWDDEEHTVFAPEEIWIVDNVIAFTEDNWATSKMAIGKIFDPNFVSEENPQGLRYGIAAPYLVGQILIGNNLYIDTPDGFFRVDGNGVQIDSMKFMITHGDTTDNLDDYLTSRENEITQEFKDAIDEITDSMGDGQVVTYYSEEYPADAKEGDLWFVDGESDISHNGETYIAGTLYRYNGTSWDMIKDAEITQAIKDAANAQATADGKIVSYYQSETPVSAGVGDIWYVTGKNPDGYIEGKLYRYSGTKWELVEDNDIPVIKNDLSSAKKTLSSIITENGYLKAEQMQGVIDSQATQMKAASGNVLFDKEGLWLMNSPNKSAMTEGIWINENGILLGSGNASDDPGKNWEWATAISRDGIVAEAIAAGTLSGMKIVGGELNIGNGNFVVDKDGNLTANSGIFKGTVQGAAFKTAKGDSMMTDGYKFNADYLELRGIEIKNDDNETTFKIDANGNVTMIGDIILGSDSKITWDNVEGKPEFADVATSGSFDDLDGVPDIPVLPDYITETYIDSIEIRSPIIKANEFRIQNDLNQGKFVLEGMFDGNKHDVFTLSYADMGSNPATTMSVWGDLYFNAGVHFDDVLFFNQSINEDTYETEYTQVYGNIDFSQANVKGLESTGGTVTAVFG